MVFQGGPKEAAKMLAGLPPEQREAAISKIAGKDPKMAELLSKLIITLDDLQFITVKMLQELLREISINDLALSLRISSDNLKNFIFSNVSKSIRQDIEEVLLGPLQPVNKVQEAQEKVMVVVRRKLARGELIINKSEETIV